MSVTLCRRSISVDMQLRSKIYRQTKRNLITRLNEHQTRQSSEVCRHLMENPKHTVNFDSPIILDRSNYSTKLRINNLQRAAQFTAPFAM